MPSLPRGGGAQGPRGSAQRGAERWWGGDARGRSAELLRPRGRSCPGMGAAEGAPRSPRGGFGCWASPLSPSGGEDIGEVPGDPQPAPGSRYLPLSPWDPPHLCRPPPGPAPRKSAAPAALTRPIQTNKQKPAPSRSQPDGKLSNDFFFQVLKREGAPRGGGGGHPPPSPVGVGGMPGMPLLGVRLSVCPVCGVGVFAGTGREGGDGGS